MTTTPVRFEALIERHHDEIYGYLYRLTHSGGGFDQAVEAEDLTQEVFLRAYGAFERLSPGSNYRAWLYKIATNCAYTALKRGQRHAQRQVPLLVEEAHALPAGEGRTPEGQVVLNERVESVRREIGSLPPKQQAAVVLRYGQGLDYRAIAQALACSEDSARANVYQGLRRVRRALAAEGVENGGAG
jgi:RNA polymerase sigma-70 factor (ECF subfamily)